MKRATYIAACAVLIGLTLSFGGCASRSPARNPLGERLPEATTQTLGGADLMLPGDLAGEPAILIIGYVQEAQFDADRWLLGLIQAEVDERLLEVPTIPGALVGLLSSRIDEGMRSGIPRADWASVATAYGEGAARLERFTGSVGPRNVRVLLLDSAGAVRWFHDQGYSAGSLVDLLATITTLEQQGTR